MQQASITHVSRREGPFVCFGCNKTYAISMHYYLKHVFTCKDAQLRLDSGSLLTEDVFDIMREIDEHERYHLYNVSSAIHCTPVSVTVPRAAHAYYGKPCTSITSAAMNAYHDYSLDAYAANANHCITSKQCSIDELVTKRLIEFQNIVSWIVSAAVMEHKTKASVVKEIEEKVMRSNDSLMSVFFRYLLRNNVVHDIISIDLIIIIEAQARPFFDTFCKGYEEVIYTLPT